MPAALVDALRAVVPAGVGLDALLAHEAAAAGLRRWCRVALAETHLVPVAAALVERFDASEAKLAALGIPVDVLAAFPGWRHGRREGFALAPLGVAPPPAGAAVPVRAVRLQLSPLPHSVGLALRLVRDLLGALEPATRIVVVVEPGADLDGLAALVAEMGERDPTRVRFVELRAATIFAQDNARGAVAADGTPVLLTPRAFRTREGREDDQLDPTAAAAAFGVPVVASRTWWEGGNVVHDEGPCFVGVDTVRENMARLGLTAEEAVRALEADLGAPVVPLGNLEAAAWDADGEHLVASGQASWHLDLDLAPLGRWGRRKKPLALIADPQRGMDLLPAVQAQRALFRDQFLPPARLRDLATAEWIARAQRVHPLLVGYAEVLEGLGYRVEGLPDLQIDLDADVFGRNLSFGYGNVLPGLHHGRPAVRWLPWGVPALDEAAAARLLSVGVEPVRIGADGAVANALMRLAGGLHCVCGTV